MQMPIRPDKVPRPGTEIVIGRHRPPLSVFVVVVVVVISIFVFVRLAEQSAEQTRLSRSPRLDISAQARGMSYGARALTN